MSCVTFSRVCFIALSVVILGCGSSAKQTKSNKSGDGASGLAGPAGSGEPVQLEVDGNTAIQRIDVNRDKRPDVYKFYRLVGDTAGKKAEDIPKMLIRKEMDVNFDQKIDIVQYFRGEPGKEVMIREEMDLDFDGRVDTTRRYKKGFVHLVELDLGFDGRVDTWRLYQLTKDEAGRTVNRLIEKRKDTTGDGNVNEWEYYTAGLLTKIGVDTTGDGAPDRFRRLDKKAK